MIPIEEVVVVRPGAGGANEKLSPTEINDNQSARPDSSTLPLKNVHTNKVGKIIKRNGYTVYSNGRITVGATTIDEVCGAFQYRKFSGTSFLVVAGSTGSTVKLIDLTTPASPSDITGAITFTPDTQFDFAVVADKLIMTTEDRDAPFKWTGTGNASALGGSPPSGKFCEEFFNYAFIANTSANPERVFWSALFDPESWTTGSDFKRLEDSCTGLCRRGNDLFAFTRNSIWVIQYTADPVTPFNFERLDSGVGCISNRSIVNIEGVIHWRAGDGHIYRMQGYKPERVTEAIPVTISELNLGAGAITCGIDHKELRQYWCAVAKDSSTVCDFVVVLDYLNNELFLYDGMSINCTFNMIDSNGDSKTYFGDRTGRIYLTNNGNSDYPGGTQTSIEWWKYTKAYHWGKPGTRKRLRRIRANINNGGNYSSLLNVIGDWGATGGQALSLNHNGGGKLLGSTWVLGVDTLGRKSDRVVSIDAHVNANTFQFKFNGDAYGQPVEINDVTYYVQSYRQDKQG